MVVSILRRILDSLNYIFGLKWLDYAISHPLFSLLFFPNLILLIYVAYLDWKEDRPYSTHEEPSQFTQLIKDNKGIVTLFAVVLMVLSVSVVGGFGGGPERVDWEPVTPDSANQDVTPTPTPESNFAFYIDITENRVSQCGLNICVNATATITNVGSLPARSVSVKVELFVNLAGTKQTIWEDNERVGNLRTGESYSTTQTMEIGARDALLVKNNGCAFSSQWEVNYNRGQKIYSNKTDLPNAECEII